MAASKWTGTWLKEETDPEGDIPSWDREITGMAGKTNVRNLERHVKPVVPCRDHMGGAGLIKGESQLA
jgi:hypothetical protein